MMGWTRDGVTVGVRQRMESEDDDDDFGVRRGRAPSGRKRRALGMDEEEED